MGTVYFTSDLHLGFHKIGAMRHPTIHEVTDVESNQSFIRQHWRAGKRDKVIIAGDLCNNKDYLSLLAELPGRKEIILGNHDLENSLCPSLDDLNRISEHIYPCREYHWRHQHFLITHIPVNEGSLRGCINIHGHEHHADNDMMNIQYPNYDPRYINVNMDVLWPRTGTIMLNLDELFSYGRL